MKNAKRIGILIVIVGIAVLGCAFLIWKLHVPTPTAHSAGEAARTQLQADLRQTTPHFLDAEQAVDREPPAPQEQKIHSDVVALLLANRPADADFYSQLWIDAIGARYILVTQPIAESSYDEIVDSQTGMVRQIPESARYDLEPLGRNAMLYIDAQHIYLYTLDQPAPALVPGSALSGTETYTSGEADTPDVIPRMSYTPDSITITIFDSSKRVPNPKLGVGATMNAAVREATLSF
jgi:hypothetical protein